MASAASSKRAGAAKKDRGGVIELRSAKAGTRRRARAGGRADAGSARATVTWLPRERTEFLIETVGGVRKLARTLGVSESQPSRWRSGDEVPSPEVAAKLLDLDHVLALAAQAWDADIVWDWMTSANAFLEGARPVDVLMERGSAEVIDALKATLGWAYA